MTMRRIVVNAPYPFEAEARIKHYRFSPYLEENTTRLQLKKKKRESINTLRENANLLTTRPKAGDSLHIVTTGLTNIMVDDAEGSAPVVQKSVIGRTLRHPPFSFSIFQVAAFQISSLKYAP
jgi:hypothetical protein